jgi:hypothetical protein
MPEAAVNQSHVVLPVELQHRGYRSEGSREKRKGKGARRRSGDKAAPKERLALHFLRVVEHETNTGTCTHELWALDGAVVTVPPGADVTLAATYVECLDCHWREDDDGHHLVGTLRVPCHHGVLRVEMDYAGDRPTTRANGTPLALADWVRPIAEVSLADTGISGLRSDVESVFSWLKDLLPRGRAGSLDPEHFFLDVIGAGLLCNAIAWDVHVAQHTRCAQYETRDARKRTLRAVS